MAKITLGEHENKYENECKYSCKLYTVLFSITFTINIGIGTFFVTINIWIMIKIPLSKKALFCKQQFTKYINGKYQTYKH